MKYSVTRGLSAFLLLCYSQCTKITFQLLSREVIVSHKGTPEVSLTMYGGLHYFGQQHIIYAIPALTCLLTLIMLPLIYLFFIPVLLQLLSMCGLGEHPLVGLVLKMFCQPRLMPLLDTFQSCFTPKLRFFAGLYFTYRVAIYGVTTFSRNEARFYATTELILLVMLGFHAIAQPYKERRNNLVDGLLFLNLAIINGLNIAQSASSALNYRPTKTGFSLLILSSQLILIYLPVITVVFRLLILVIWSRCTKQYALQESHEEIDAGRGLFQVLKTVLKISMISVRRKALETHIKHLCACVTCLLLIIVYMAHCIKTTDLLLGVDPKKQLFSRFPCLCNYSSLHTRMMKHLTFVLRPYNYERRKSQSKV